MKPNWFASFLSVSALLFGAKIFGAGSGFLTHVLLARTLSSDALGKYFLVVSVISLCAIFAAFGYPSIMGRFISRYMSQFTSRYRRATNQSLLSGFLWYAKTDTLRNAALFTPLAIAWIAFGPSVQLTDGISLACIALAIPASYDAHKWVPCHRIAPLQDRISAGSAVPPSHTFLSSVHICLRL